MGVILAYVLHTEILWMEILCCWVLLCGWCQGGCSLGGSSGQVQCERGSLSVTSYRGELASLCNDLILHLHQTIFWWCCFCHPSSLEQTPWTSWERTAGVGVEATAHKSVKSLFSTCCVLIFRVCYRLQKLGWSFGQESFAIIQILTGESNLGVSSGKGISDFIIVSNCSEETCPQRYAFLYISFRIKREKLLFLEPCR